MDKDSLLQLIEYSVPVPLKLREWNNPRKLDKQALSTNINSGGYLQFHPRMVSFTHLVRNPSTIPIIERHLDKIDWSMLSRNPNAIHLLEQNPDKIWWNDFSMNPNIFIRDDEKYEKLVQDFLQRYSNLLLNIY